MDRGWVASQILEMTLGSLSHIAEVSMMEPRIIVLSKGLEKMDVVNAACCPSAGLAKVRAD